LIAGTENNPSVACVLEHLVAVVRHQDIAAGKDKAVAGSSLHMPGNMTVLVDDRCQGTRDQEGVPATRRAALVSEWRQHGGLLTLSDRVGGEQRQKQGNLNAQGILIWGQTPAALLLR